jgi:aryl-alcohol dehydrogenase-like predicted oxidoreductase
MHIFESLADYRLLGNSGLRVSPLCLGTMTFGEDWGMGRDESRRIFDAYVEHGGNFIDTANSYSKGLSEELVGTFAEGRRDRLVIATKYSLNMEPTDPNAGGNHRKNMQRSIEASLKRLRTDHIDLFYLHVWDNTTPVDEILRGLDDLVRQGKVLYVGISDTPAWQVARMQTIAELRGWSRLVALQVEYSLIERTVERDLVPMARELGLGVLPWSPLASGILSGKYSRSDMVKTGSATTQYEGRKGALIENGMVNERAITIAEVVKQIAEECHAKPAQVALAWLLNSPAVTAPIIGVRTFQQFESNLGALGLVLDTAQLVRLDEASRSPAGFPHEFLRSPMIQYFLFGESKVQLR